MHNKQMDAREEGGRRMNGTGEEEEEVQTFSYKDK